MEAWAEKTRGQHQGGPQRMTITSSHAPQVNACPSYCGDTCVQEHRRHTRPHRTSFHTWWQSWGPFAGAQQEGIVRYFESRVHNLADSLAHEGPALGPLLGDAPCTVCTTNGSLLLLVSMSLQSHPRAPGAPRRRCFNVKYGQYASY